MVNHITHQCAPLEDDISDYVDMRLGFDLQRENCSLETKSAIWTYVIVKSGTFKIAAGT